MKLKVGLIGCGAIGNVIYNAIVHGVAPGSDKDSHNLSERFEVVGVYDLKLEESRKMAGKLAVDNFEKFLLLDMDIVVEAASQNAVREYGEIILESGKELLIMSVGAFSDDLLLKRIREAAIKNEKRVYLPSGAISGIDAIKAVKEFIVEASLTTTKNPRSLVGAPFFENKDIDIDPSKLKGKTVLFEGSAREAIDLFPQNVNVAAILSLAGVGFDRTKIRIIADPDTDKNTHEIMVKGAFGTIRTISENVPSPDNPKTSYLAAISAVQTLRNLRESIIIGT